MSVRKSLQLRRAVALALLIIAALTMLFAAPPSADAQADPEAGVAVVLEANGLLDPIVADHLISGIESANAEGAVVVVLNVDSRGSVLDDDEFRQVAATIRDSVVPVTMWIGPSQVALGDWVDLASQVDRFVVATGGRFGDAPTVSPLGEGFDLTRFEADRQELTNVAINAERAEVLGISDYVAPTIGEFLVGLNDLGVQTVAEGNGTQLSTVAVFTPLNLVQQQMHTVASPPVAYLLFAVGLALLVFEFYTAGVGVAGVVGAVMVVLGTYGLNILPTRWWAVALIIFSMFAFSIDVQTGVPRLWTIIGSLALLIGTLFLFGDGASMSWIPMLVGVVGIAAMMVSGMPTMVRTRFSTPTIGREWMVGTTGEAAEAIDPDGVVTIDGAMWRARTNRATPIGAGDVVRVAGVDGLFLEVEPTEGAARDYRERR